MSRHMRVVRNILAMLVNQVGSWSITFVLTLFLPPYLGLKNFGLYSFITSYVGFFALGMTLGTGSYLTWRIAREPDEASSLMFNTLLLQVPLGLITSVIGLALLPSLDHRSLALELGMLVFCSNFLSALAATGASVLGGFQIMRAPAFIGLAANVVGASLILLGIHLHVSVLGIAAAALVAQIISVTATLLYAQSKLRLRARINLRLWPKIIAGGMPFFAWYVVLMFYWQIDVSMLKVMVGDSVVGWYAAANRIVSIPVFLPNIVITAILPALSRERTADSPYFRELASRSIRMVTALTIPAATGTMLLASSIIGILHYPASFNRVTPLIEILSLNMPLVALDMVLGTVLIALGRQKAWTVVGIVAAILNPLANLWAIPFTQHVYGNGAIGASWTTIMSEVIMLIGALVLRPRSVLTGSDVFYLFRGLLAAGLMVPAVWALSTLGSVNILVAVGYGMVVYFMAAYTLQVIRNDDLRGLLNVVPRKMGMGELSEEQVRDTLRRVSASAAASAAALGHVGATLSRPLVRAGVTISQPLVRVGGRISGPLTTRLRDAAGRISSRPLAVAGGDGLVGDVAALPAEGAAGADELMPMWAAFEQYPGAPEPASEEAVPLCDDCWEIVDEEEGRQTEPVPIVRLPAAEPMPPEPGAEQVQPVEHDLVTTSKLPKRSGRRRARQVQV